MHETTAAETWCCFGNFSSAMSLPICYTPFGLTTACDSLCMYKLQSFGIAQKKKKKNHTERKYLSNNHINSFLFSCFLSPKTNCLSKCKVLDLKGIFSAGIWIVLGISYLVIASKLGCTVIFKRKRASQKGECKLPMVFHFTSSLM